MSKSCRKCLLNDAISPVRIESSGLCNFCTGSHPDEWEARFEITPEKKTILYQEMQALFDSVRGTSEYDCVIGLSGGKDSSYLLWYLVEELKLKVLAIYVNTPFESSLAKENMEILKSKLTFDFECIDLDPEFFKIFYRTLFEHPVDEGYVKTICYVCGPMFTGQCMKVAAERRIPIVALGLSPNQPDNMFFEWAQELVKHDWIPDVFKGDAFSDDFKSNFWNPALYPEGTPLPRVIAPLHVMDYNEEAIKSLLEQRGILPKKRTNPADTNCALNWPMMLLDTKLLGHNPYIKEFASKVRKGEASRTFWKSLLSIIHLQIKLGVFKRKTIREVEKMLDMRFSECPTDPNVVTRKFKEYP